VRVNRAKSTPTPPQNNCIARGHTEIMDDNNYNNQQKNKNKKVSKNVSAPKSRIPENNERTDSQNPFFEMKYIKKYTQLSQFFIHQNHITKQLKSSACWI